MCGDAVCPGSLVCVRPNECIRAEILAACDGKQESDVCTTPEGVSGVCGGGVCVPDTCGDGRVSFGEVCDGDDLGSYTCQTFGFYNPEGLRCGTDCGFDLSQCGGICGDQTANGGEQCDTDDLRGQTCQSLGYYYPDNLACSSSCFLDVSACEGKCGDDVLDSVEYCDGAPPEGDSCLTFGFGAGQLGCSKLCGADLAACHHVRWRTLDTHSAMYLHHVWVGDAGEIVAVGEGASVHLQGSNVDPAFVRDELHGRRAGGVGRRPGRGPQRAVALERTSDVAGHTAIRRPDRDRGGRDAARSILRGLGRRRKRDGRHAPVQAIELVARGSPLQPNNAPVLCASRSDAAGFNGILRPGGTS